MFEERYDDQWEKANDGLGNGSKGQGKGQGKGTKGDGFGRQQSRQGPPGSAFSPTLSAQAHTTHMAVHGVHSDFAAGLHLFVSRQWRA